MATRIAVPRETAEGERRVALVPEVVGRLVKRGLTVSVENGAGIRAGYPDAAYVAAGASVEADAAALAASAELWLSVQPPTTDQIRALPANAWVVTQVNAARNGDRVRAMRDRPITCFALELLPRITRAQGMDILSSQATVAGYKAALLGANATAKLWPMLTTAAGTIRPAQVLVLGAGVAGLMAIATARRLGAVVEAYDVRRAAGEQVRSLGARFLELAINAEGQGGYARELTTEEKAQERQMVEKAVANADVVITTAAIPGRRAPILVTKEMVASMRPGAVLVDLSAESGGNCELTKPGETVVAGAVTILGPLNLPSALAFHASQMWARNVLAFLGLLLAPDGSRVGAFADEILSACLLTHEGKIVHAPTRALVDGPGDGA